MGRILELSNSQNWENIYNTTVSAVQVPLAGGGFLQSPIPEIIVPLLLEKQILAVLINTNVPDGRKWYFGGFLYQRFQLGLVVGGNPDASNISRRRIQLGKVQLVTFTKLTNTYSLAISVPPWFPSASIIIWEYTGIDYDSIELAVNRIEQKLDTENEEDSTDLI